jgi:eukaryotic-like serine/threonine-protein kinase
VEMSGREIGGRYRLSSPLGEGGMATLWRAVDQQLGREVAVKLLRPQYSADPGFAARFRQEARSAASLSHPNIVSVYDYGTDPDGETQFIVMQLVEGENLAEILRRRGHLSTDDSVRVAVAVAAALEAAHRRGIVHRDVKPGNILITEDGDVKVTDFGIARAVSEASMTITGTTLGSVHYFSPEQARGDEVTGASDVYSLGIVLYEMLTGRRPFEGDSAAGVALKRLTEPPPRPMVDGHPLPPGLEAILRRALERDPARRFPDAGSFAESLRAWTRDRDARPAAAAPPTAAAAVPPPPAATPPAGEPTVYVPPPVARPSDRVPYSVNRPPARSQARPQGDNPSWWIWLLALLAVVLLGAIGFLAVQVFGSLAPGGSATPTPAAGTVPNWVNQPIAAVRAQAAQAGITLVEQPPQSSDTVPADQVISTDPAVGQPLPADKTVTVVVSSGPATVNVPPLIGQTREEAASTLGAVGLLLGNVTSEPSDQAAGEVIRSDPAAGVPVKKGSPVNLVLSSGPTPSPTPTPTPVPTPSPTPTPSPSPSATSPAA